MLKPFVSSFADLRWNAFGLKPTSLRLVKVLCIFHEETTESSDCCFNRPTLNGAGAYFGLSCCRVGLVLRGVQGELLISIRFLSSVGGWVINPRKSKVALQQDPNCFRIKGKRLPGRKFRFSLSFRGRDCIKPDSMFRCTRRMNRSRRQAAAG